MPHARTRFGSRGEELAAMYLTREGYRILERNVRTHVGELDLVCLAPRPPKPWRRRELVFVEVKTRSSHAYGHPEESVTHAKQQHLVRAAHAYRSANTALHTAQFRIDVVAITYRGDAEPEIVHIPNAVGAV